MILLYSSYSFYRGAAAESEQFEGKFGALCVVSDRIYCYL